MVTTMGTCVADTPFAGPYCHWSCDGTLDTVAESATCGAANDDSTCKVCVGSAYIAAADGVEGTCTVCNVDWCLKCNDQGNCELWDYLHYEAYDNGKLLTLPDVN